MLTLSVKGSNLNACINFRDPCQPTLKESVRKIFKDASKTDQVRIHAYLAASKCLTSEDKTAIQEVFSQGNSPGWHIMFL